MQDLETLEGKNLAELREIAKALGVKNVMTKKKKELTDEIVRTSEAAAAAEEKVAPETAPAAEAVEKPRRGRRPRLADRKSVV